MRLQSKHRPLSRKQHSAKKVGKRYFKFAKRTMSGRTRGEKTIKTEHLEGFILKLPQAVYSIYKYTHIDIERASKRLNVVHTVI